MWAVLNPISRKHRAAQHALIEACKRAGLATPQILTTTREDPGTQAAKHAVEQGADVVIAGGGDGTVRAVAQALTSTNTHLGILPLGTANLFAYNLRLRTRDLNLAARRALSPVATPFDVGWASWREVHHGWVGPPTPESAFLVMAGLGHDAATVLGTRPEIKRHLGAASYISAGVRTLFARPIPMRISVDAQPGRRIETWTTLIANCGRIPGGIKVFPGARPDDGVLDVLEVPLKSTWQWGAVAAKGLIGFKADVTALRYGRAETVWVVPGHPVPLQLDGEVVETVADLRIRVDAGALLVRTGR